MNIAPMIGRPRTRHRSGLRPMQRRTGWMTRFQAGTHTGHKPRTGCGMARRFRRPCEFVADRPRGSSRIGGEGETRARGRAFGSPSFQSRAPVVHSVWPNRFRCFLIAHVLSDDFGNVRSQFISHCGPRSRSFCSDARLHAGRRPRVRLHDLIAGVISGVPSVSASILALHFLTPSPLHFLTSSPSRRPSC